MKKQLVLLILILGAALALAGCGGGGGDTTEPASVAPRGQNTSSGNPDEGKNLFAGTCSACHGPEGLGVAGLGKDLTTSTFVMERTDAEVLEFLKTGRPASDPLNTTGVDMPPKGGNPALNDDKLLDIIAYLRVLEQ
ncbi:MAG TPA: cytochrome c [Chloroflexota bacterium]|nr:cytochrome c [Chloroflexota bacterium]HUM72315.1 cytochrome c [Chloroflexota bacterium]